MEIRRLFRAVVEILHEAVKHQGSTLSDQQYVDLLGRPGEYQNLHNVYDRAGQSCQRCRGRPRREKFQSRSHLLLPQLPSLNWQRGINWQLSGAVSLGA